MGIPKRSQGILVLGERRCDGDDLGGCGAFHEKQRLRRQAGIEIGDYVEVRLEEGRLVLLPRQVMAKDQAWFWTAEWQAGEREAKADIRAGRVKALDTLEDLIADLDAGETED